MGLFMAIMLLSNRVESRKDKKSKDQQPKTPQFTEDQCFCGIRYDRTKKLNLDLFGSQVAGQILNYVDQSISKFNALNLKSELALTYNGNRSKKNNPYHQNGTDFLNNLTRKNSAELTMNSKEKQLNNLKITYLKTVLFTKDQNNNKILKMEFMMGRRVSFHILIKLIDNSKKQFDISIVRDPYVPGNPEKTREERRKNPEGFTKGKVFRSLSHFDKNQLEVDVCRMMYVGLNQFVTKEFNTSIQSALVRFGKTRRSFNQAIGCQRKVFFRERYSTDYLSDLIQKYYYKLEKTNNVRAKLMSPKMNQFHMVNQDFDSDNTELTRQVTISQIEDFNDESESNIALDTTSNSQSVEEVQIVRQNVVVKDVDLDSQSNSAELSQRSSNKIEKMSEEDRSHTEEDVYNLRSRQVPKTNPTSLKDLENILNESEVSGLSLNIKKELEKSHEDVQESSSYSGNSSIDQMSVERETSQNNSNVSAPDMKMEKKKRNFPINSSNKANAVSNLMKKVMMSKFVSFKNKGNNQNSEDNLQNEVIKPKKRRRVIVLIESIECNKCANDIQTEVFLRLLNNKSYMI